MHAVQKKENRSPSCNNSILSKLSGISVHVSSCELIILLFAETSCVYAGVRSGYACGTAAGKVREYKKYIHKL